MTAQNRTALKALFQTGDTLAEGSFVDLIDSFLDLVDTGSQTIASPVTFSNAVTFSSAASFATTITVPSGGTGKTSFTSNSVICGGTSSTGALQSVDVSGVPADYVLTYVSAGAPPIWAPNTAFGGIVAIANGGTGATTAVSAFSALKQSATTSDTGVIEIATTAEALTGTDTARAITPAAFAGNKSLGVSGYYQLPGGLIVQWGYDTAATGATGTVTFPLAFSTVYTVVGLQDKNGAQYMTVHTVTTTNFQFTASGGTSTGVRWVAFGV